MNRSSFYTKVIKLYKRLYITRNQTFQDDTERLQNSLTRLRNEFRMNRDVTDPNKLEELIKTGKEVDRLLRTSVLQTVKDPTKENTFILKVKPYMIKDNHITKKP